MLRLSRAQLREVDRIAIEEYGLPGVVLMENAARNAADIIDAHFLGNGVDRNTATIVCGSGNNGGDGYAVARHLSNEGWHVTIVSLKPIDALTGDATIMANVARRMTAIHFADDLSAFIARPIGILIDAITGTGLSRPLEGVMAAAVAQMNASQRPLIALDLPSGLDCDTGESLGDACIRATKTITFAAEKIGFANPRSWDFTGEVIVADIGCPQEIVARASGT